MFHMDGAVDIIRAADITRGRYPRVPRGGSMLDVFWVVLSLFYEIYELLQGEDITNTMLLLI